MSFQKIIKRFLCKKKLINEDTRLMIDYRDKEKGLVYIETNSGSGSGFMITGTGLCFTCEHVIKDATEIFVRMDDGKERVVYKAIVVCSNESEDFAVLQLEDCTENFYFEIETDFSSLRTGDDVAIYGFPFGSDLNENVMELEPSLTKGYIASKNKIDGRNCYYLDIRSAPGNSGGPVFSLKTNKCIGYLCGSYGSDRANMIYIRTMEYFMQHIVK